MLANYNDYSYHVHILYIIISLLSLKQLLSDCGSNSRQVRLQRRLFQWQPLPDHRRHKNNYRRRVLLADYVHIDFIYSVGYVGNLPHCGCEIGINVHDYIAPMLLPSAES